MNSIIISGRLTSDPIIRQSSTGTPVTTYTLAVHRRHSGSSGTNQQDTDFVQCVAFGRVGEFAANYLTKGQLIAVEGRIQTSTYEKDGIRRYATQVVVLRHEFMEPRRNALSANAVVSPADGNAVGDSTLVDLDDDEDDLPF